MLDFGLVQKAQLAEITASVRQQFPQTTIAYDDVDPCHPLLVEAWAERVYQRLAGSPLKPEQVGLLLAASGDGAGARRSQSYRLMRLLWEQVGCARGEVGFCRHARPSLREQLERCTREHLTWVIVPQAAWRDAHDDEVRTICDDFSRTVPAARTWRITEPIGRSVPPLDRGGATPGLSTWLAERMLRLWQERRGKFAAKEPSAKRDRSPQISPSARSPGKLPAHRPVRATGRRPVLRNRIYCRGLRPGRTRPSLRTLVAIIFPHARLHQGHVARLRPGNVHGPGVPGHAARRPARTGGAPGGPYVGVATSAAPLGIGPRIVGCIAPGSPSKRRNICGVPAWRTSFASTKPST